MVLQTNLDYGARAFINGLAAPNSTVSVTVQGSKSSTYQVVAGADRSWKVTLNPVHASLTDTYKVTVASGSEQKTVENGEWAYVCTFVVVCCWMC